MPAPPPKRVAVLGGGPIGVEAALAAATAGHEVRLFERGCIGASVRDWGFVRLFSPWSLDRSPLGMRTLAELGLAPAPEGICPTGAEFVERYPELQGMVVTSSRAFQPVRSLS